MDNQRRHSLTSVGSGRSQTTTGTMSSRQPHQVRDVSTDSLLNMDDRFTPKHHKKTPSSFSSGPQQGYCFPNGEVFRPRAQPIRRNRPQKLPRAYSMTNVSMAASQAPAPSSRNSLPPLPRNNSFTSRDTLLKSIRSSRGDISTNLTSEPTQAPRSNSMQRMQSTNILRSHSTDQVPRLAPPPPSLQPPSLPQQSSSLSSLPEQPAVVSSVSEQPGVVPSLSSASSRYSSTSVSSVDDTPSARSNSNTPSTSIDGVDVVAKESESLCTLPENEPLRRPNHEPTMGRESSSTSSVSSSEPTLIRPPHPNRHNVSGPPSPSDGRHSPYEKFSSMITKKASQVFEDDNADRTVPYSTVFYEKRVIDSLLSDNTVPPRGDLAIYSKSMQSLVDSEDSIFDSVTKRVQFEMDDDENAGHSQQEQNELFQEEKVAAGMGNPPEPVRGPVPMISPEPEDDEEEKKPEKQKSPAPAVLQPRSEYYPLRKDKQQQSSMSQSSMPVKKSNLARSSSRVNIKSFFRRLFTKDEPVEEVIEQPAPEPTPPQPAEPLTLPKFEPSNSSGMEDVMATLENLDNSSKRSRVVSSASSVRYDPFVQDDELSEAQLGDQRHQDGPSEDADQYVDENILALQKEFDWAQMGEHVDLQSIYKAHTLEGPLEVIVVHRDQLQQVFEKFDVTGPHRRRLGNLKYVQQLSDFNTLQIKVRRFDQDVGTIAPAKPVQYSSLRGSGVNHPKRHRSRPRVMFANTISVNETFAPDVYSRYNRSATQNHMTNTNEIASVKEELNYYKCNEMLVHEMSQQNTHFFYQ